MICARRRYGEFYTFVKFDGKRRHHLNFVVKCLFRLDLTRIVGFCTIPTFLENRVFSMSLARLGEFNFLVKFDGGASTIWRVFGLNLTRICGFGYNFDVFLKNRVLR